MKINSINTAAALLILQLCCFSVANGQSNKPLSALVAAKLMGMEDDSLYLHPEQPKSAKWTFDLGLMFEGIDGLWERTGKGEYFKFMQRSMDYFVTNDGRFQHNELQDDRMEDMKIGRSLLTLYKVTGQIRYFKAATALSAELKRRTGTKDGLFMGQPFYAEYAALVNDQAAFEDIANQFILMEKYSKDFRTGSLNHGWDEYKYARAMGWYAMALVDVLEYFPENHPKRKTLQSLLKQTAFSIKNYLAQPDAKGNYMEGATAAMFAYSLAKGHRNGDLPVSYLAIAEQAYMLVRKVFVEESPEGTIKLNDRFGLATFLLASNELEWAGFPKAGKGKRVVLDNYFNHEIKKDQSGNDVSWHYKWAERANGGFSMWAGIFQRNGFKTEELGEGPDLKNLSHAAVYIIVDPDTEKESPRPNYIQQHHIKDLKSWVRAGGILVLMANDTGNTELDHFNQLAMPFGLQFNKDSKGRVNKNEYETARIDVPARNSIFSNSKQLFVKEFSSLTLSDPAVSILKDKSGNQVMALSKFGKGKVFVIGDPWLYNEYVDGRKLPLAYDNFTAAEDLVQWLSQQIASIHKK
ncbi:glycoside hydrolase family 88 protein [Pedobacter gandavensis]|uniref:glycoside hydrolase family 88 protein n=1 Tax=Pedobacter gandavensis TaxID=2679963 RepID=UPI00292F6A0C|nr:glycoside hydrolase family 88 protein [Pedobacter gandavensis]